MSGIKLEHDIWVVVADGEKALFLRNEGDEKYPHLEVFREMNEDNPPTHDQGTDKPGRFADGGTSVHKSAVQETDWHRVEKERFAKEIAARLYKSAHKGDFKRLVIVAPPLVMGEMRKELHKEVEDRVIAELPKTLTNHTVDEIEKILMKG
ncbi:host attachment family protein [Mesorhizobium sp. CAU 1741]|uniref:host attachment family protein n=1 Tax=Mesorhizobium sp. CAU 1741 TaxID=3140366 RepID=UPI00325B8796